MISAGVCGFGSVEACAAGAGLDSARRPRSWIWAPGRSARQPRPVGSLPQPVLRAASAPHRRFWSRWPSRRCGHDGRRGLLVLDGDGSAALIFLVVGLAAPEQRGEQAGLLADGCGVVAIAALLDVGAGEFITLQRTTIRGQVDGAAVGKHPGQLIMGHARPVTDAAGIEMNERRSRGRIEADAAALQAKAGGADLLERNSGDEEIHRVAEHVLAVASHAGRTAAEHGIGGGGAVGGDDLDRLLAVDVAVDFPEDVEQVTIHRGLVLAAPVAEEVIEFLQRLFVVAAVALEGDGEVFVGMGVVEGKRAGFVQRGRVLHRPGSGKEQQGSQAELISGLR